MPETIHFAPNVPVLLCLADSEGTWDADLRQGQYQTTTGQSFSLPRAAVVALNMLEPRPGEEIQITRFWKGRPSDPIEWTVCLSPASEKLRARQEMASQEGETGLDLTAALQASIDRTQRAKPILEAPSVVKRPLKREVVAQPRLGTGTDGPLPVRLQRNGVIPWNVAFREVSAWVSRELAANQLQWSDAAQQDLCSTVLIAASKAGQIGMWERGE
jgi:hypothetical protein